MRQAKASGKLRIGDNWNAITIIALSQSNPLKAIAEFVENSIDAKAKNVTIIRGKERGDYYLKVIDDGEGIDDFGYVATHIGDSIKRKLKARGATGVQGEFGIGLLSFWTVGDELLLTSTGSDGTARRMKLVKQNPAYSVAEVPELFNKPGTELRIFPILAGVRTLSGEKMQSFLASELRDRISKSSVRIKIVDRTARKELVVEPRKFHGRLIHALPEAKSPAGDIYVELYLSEPSKANQIGLYKQGTRVIGNLTEMDRFCRFPWTSDYLEGIIDVSFLQLTPGTRDGVVFDHAFESFAVAIEPIEERLAEIIAEQEHAEEEEASRTILHKVTKALREAFLLLPRESYGWLPVQGHKKEGFREGNSSDAGDRPGLAADVGGAEAEISGEPPAEAAEAGDAAEGLAGNEGQNPVDRKQFFDFPGALHAAIISPASSVVRVGEKRRFRVIGRDKSRRPIDSGLEIEWRIQEGAGSIDSSSSEFIELTAPAEPGIIQLAVIVKQGEIERNAEAVVTVAAELLGRSSRDAPATKKGLPGYTYRNAPGELWRSTYDEENHLVVINSGHADFIFASRAPQRKLKYIARLFAKELVLANFPEENKGELLERVIELTLYMEESLK